MTWVHAQSPRLFPVGDPAKGTGELGLPPLEPRALSESQVRSLKNLCDRLERFHQRRGQRWMGKRGDVPVRVTGRPLRDRAIMYVHLSTGLRREELMNLDVDQVSPNTSEALRQARQGRIARVEGKGRTERTVFLSNDARLALAIHVVRECPRDVGAETTAICLSAVGIPARAQDGRLPPRAINRILTQIGRWHGAELMDPTGRHSPLKPHDLRHTFAFQLAKATGADAYELARRLGHRSQRYIQRDTNPLREPPGVRERTGHDEGSGHVTDRLTAFLLGEGITLSRADTGSAKGYDAPRRCEIVLRRDIAGEREATTRTHETAHYLADHRGEIDRGDAETVAESAAYVVMHHTGIDTGTYNSAYVARWAQDMQVFRRNLHAVQQVSHRLIETVGDACQPDVERVTYALPFGEYAIIGP